MKRTLRRKGAAAAGISIAAAIALVGCAGGGTTPTAAPETPSAPEPLSIATLAPGTSTPGIVLGKEAGIFEEHFIDLTETHGPSGSVIVSSLIGGETDTVGVSWVPIIVAASQGVPLTTVSTSGSQVGPGLHGIFVRADAGITDCTGLEGKTLAVNALGSLGELAYRECMEAAGADPQNLNLTELAIPDMIPALEQGNIDAAWLPGPFYMAGMANANLQLLTDFSDIESIDGLPNVGYVGMRPWVEQHRDLVARFNEALGEAVEYVNADESLVRQMQVDIGGLPEDLAAVIALEPHTPVLPREDVQRLIDLMLKWGVIEEAPDLDALYPAS